VALAIEAAMLFRRKPPSGNLCMEPCPEQHNELKELLLSKSWTKRLPIHNGIAIPVSEDVGTERTCMCLNQIAFYDTQNDLYVANGLTVDNLVQCQAISCEERIEKNRQK
jgi:transketolase